MLKEMLVLLTLSASVSALAESTYSIQLGTKVEWTPYHMDTPLGGDGMAVRAVACIMSRINQPFMIQKRPWKRAQEETKVGQLDGFFSASKNDTRDSYATLSKVFLPQERIFYSLKKHINIPLESYTLDYIHLHVSVGARDGSNTLNSLKKGGLDFPIFYGYSKDPFFTHELRLPLTGLIIKIRPI